MFDAKEKSCRKKRPVVIPAHGSRVNLYLFFYFVFQILDAFPRGLRTSLIILAFALPLAANLSFIIQIILNEVLLG